MRFLWLIGLLLSDVVFSQSITIDLVPSGKSNHIDSVWVRNYDTKTDVILRNTRKIVLASSEKKKKRSYKNGGEKMAIAAGDTLRYEKGQLLFIEAFASNMKTVVPLVPEQDTVVEFYFDECVDADGNSYAIMKVCNMLWMVDNLRVTKTRSGVPLHYGKERWDADTVAYRKVYDADKYIASYGLLYNWYAATSGILPQGWQLPSVEDWNRFEKCTEFGKNAVGNRLKELRLIPAGYCDVSGEFSAVGEEGYWWLSDELSQKKAWYFLLNANNASVGLNVCDKHHGFSVRGVKYLNR